MTVEVQVNGTPVRGITSLARVNLIGVSVEAKYVPAAQRLDVTVSADPAGATFPDDPYDGQTFYRTDLSDLFAWDDTRGKWLSVRTTMAVFSAQTLVAAGAALRLFQAPTSSATVGFRMSWDATLVEANSTRVTSGSATQLDVRAAAVVKHSHSVGAGVVTADEQGINVDFAADDIVNVVANTDLTGGGHIALWFRRRAA